MALKLYKPEVFQGNQGKRKYFEGWYFKHVSGDLGNVYSFIPGISLSGTASHAFIQVVNGISGQTAYIEYPPESFKWDNKELYLKIGNSEFTENHIILDITQDTTRINGRIDYTGNVKYPKTLLSPGIMGWYSFVPFMECKHGIVSANHSLAGSISINNATIDFTGGKGYIEKDWGTSFPEAWIWLQCNNFSDPGTSFCFSIAKIPWIGKFFIGFFAFLLLNNRFILFSTYKKSKVSQVRNEGEVLKFTLENADYVLRAETCKRSFGELRAPSTGEMSRRIKESIDSEIHLILEDKKGNVLYNDTGRRAGLEIIDRIFDYL